MEKIKQEVYKSGDKTFLTESECLKYEHRIRISELSSKISEFLIGEGFIRNLNRMHKKFDFTHYQFEIISDYIYLRKYISQSPIISFDLEEPEEKIKLSLCNIETFKRFYFEMIIEQVS